MSYGERKMLKVYLKFCNSKFSVKDEGTMKRTNLVESEYQLPSEK